MDWSFGISPKISVEVETPVRNALELRVDADEIQLNLIINRSKRLRQSILGLISLTTADSSVLYLKGGWPVPLFYLGYVFLQASVIFLRIYRAKKKGTKVAQIQIFGLKI